MHSPLRKFLKIGTIVLFVLAIGSYALYQSSTFLKGPEVMLDQPEDGIVVFSPTITLSGNSNNISRFFLDDRQIFVDENGNFEEKLLALPGYTIISLRAEDKFGRTFQENIHVVYREQ